VSDLCHCGMTEVNSEVIDHDDTRFRMALENAVDSNSSVNSSELVNETVESSSEIVKNNGHQDQLLKFLSHAMPPSKVRVSPCANGWLWVMGIAGFCDTLDSGDNNSLGVVTRKADHKWEDQEHMSKGGPVFKALTSLKG